MSLILAAALALSPLAAILPESATRMALQQCSRAAPAAQGSWRPTPADVARLEATLGAALAAHPRGRTIGYRADRWRRQYVGLVRGGRRFLYGNFYPAGLSDDLQWRRRVVLVCDGGPAFFGVELDVASGRITHLDFNGAV